MSKLKTGLKAAAIALAALRDAPEGGDAGRHLSHVAKYQAMLDKALSKRKKRMSSYSGGKFKKPRKVKPFGFSRGATLITEQHAVFKSDNSAGPGNKQVLTVGMISQPEEQMLRVVAMALIKQLSVKMNRPFENWSQVIADVTVGSIFYCTVRQSTATTSDVNNTFYTHAAGQTWNDALNGLISDWNAYQTEFIVTRIVALDGATNSTYVQLDNALVSVQVKADLKLQNQSVTTAGDDEDDVNNVPLYGKLYQGKGTGVYKLANTNSTNNRGFFGHRQTGLIERQTVTTNVATEPPLGWEFEKTPKIASARLEPGQIKTATLYDEFTVPLNKFLLHWSRQGNPTLGEYRTGNGKYKFFVFEKMLEPVALAGARADMTVALELNAKYSAIIRLRTNNKTEPLVVDN